MADDLDDVGLARAGPPGLGQGAIGEPAPLGDDGQARCEDGRQPRTVAATGAVIGNGVGGDILSRAEIAARVETPWR